MARKVIRAKIGPPKGLSAGGFDPHQLFVNADNFRHSLESLVQLPGNIKFGQSIIVLAAFSSELCIKCIIFLESGQRPWGHDLEKLFAKISGRRRTEIEKLWASDFVPKREDQLAEVEKKIYRDLKLLLSLGAHTFDDVRYAHDKAPAGNFYLTDLPTLLRRVIIEMKPNWN